VSRDEARDWLLLAYVVAYLTEGAALVAAWAAHRWSLPAGLLCGFLIGCTKASRRAALRRLDDR
jgi:hypothetical protein